MTRVPPEKIYGLESARAVMAARPDDVIRIAHTEAVRYEVAEILREAAARRIAYEERSEEDLERIAGAVHHEGICLAVRPRRVLSVDALLGALRDGKCRGALALDDVGNPHNAGAIVRTAAFFGIDALLVEGDTPLTPAAVRIARGAAEQVKLVRCDDLPAALARIAAERVAVIGTDVRAERALADLRWPARAVIVMGSEASGMRPEVRSACTQLVRIEGSGRVESLNVGVAAGVVLAAWRSG